jgi:hypothetical protein
MCTHTPCSHRVGYKPYIANSMEQSPSQVAKSHSASQEITLLLWNPRVHYHIHNSPPQVAILSQMNQFQTFPKIHSNIIVHLLRSRFSE